MSRTSGLTEVAIIYRCWDTGMEEAEQEPGSKPVAVIADTADPTLQSSSAPDEEWVCLEVTEALALALWRTVMTHKGDGGGKLFPTRLAVRPTILSGKLLLRLWEALYPSFTFSFSACFLRRGASLRRESPSGKGAFPNRPQDSRTLESRRVAPCLCFGACASSSCVKPSLPRDGSAWE